MDEEEGVLHFGELTFMKFFIGKFFLFSIFESLKIYLFSMCLNKGLLWAVLSR